MQNKSQDSSTIQLIYEDAGSSIKFLRDDISALNARLGVLLGFNAAFIRLSMDLPDRSSCTHFSAQVLTCYSCQGLKALALAAVMLSVGAILKGVAATGVDSILDPEAQLKKLTEIKTNLGGFAEEQATEDEFREKVIEYRGKTITAFVDLSAKKATALNGALVFFGIAAALTALELLVQIFFC